jgi:hypothetical protein
MIEHYTTIAIDNNGKVYDLSKESPPYEVMIVNAYTCTIEECERLKEKYLKKDKKKKK